MGVAAVTYPRRSAWFSIIVRSSADGRAAVLLAVGDEASREPMRKVRKDLPPLTDSVESMERDSEAKLSTRGGMVLSWFVVRWLVRIWRYLCVLRFAFVRWRRQNSAEEAKQHNKAVRTRTCVYVRAMRHYAINAIAATSQQCRGGLKSISLFPGFRRHKKCEKLAES